MFSGLPPLMKPFSGPKSALKVLKSTFTAAHEKEVMALEQTLLHGKNADEKEAVLMNYVHCLLYPSLLMYTIIQP